MDQMHSHKWRTRLAWRPVWSEPFRLVKWNEGLFGRESMIRHLWFEQKNEEKTPHIWPSLTTVKSRCAPAVYRCGALGWIAAWNARRKSRWLQICFLLVISCDQRVTLFFTVLAHQHTWSGFCTLIIICSEFLCCLSITKRSKHVQN